MAHKSTNAEVIQRVEETVEMIIDGFSYSEMVRHAAKTWKITSRQTDDYIARAKDIIQANADKKAEKQFEIAVGRAEKIYRKAHKAGKFSIALEAQKDINNLFGLYAPKRTEIRLEFGELSDDQLDSKITELEAYCAGHEAGKRAATKSPARESETAKGK